MAIGIGSVVSPKVNAAAFMPSAAGPMFGVSESAGTPFDVTWADGKQGNAIPLTSLDEILAATGGSASTQFVGQRVKRTTPAGAGESGYGYFTCLQVYNRNGTDVGLLQNDNGAFIEAAVSILELVP